MSNGNPAVPHSVFLVVSAQVREVMKTGHVSGNIAHTHKSSRGEEREVFRFDAPDRDFAIKRLNEVIDLLRKEGFKKDA